MSKNTDDDGFTTVRGKRNGKNRRRRGGDRGDGKAPQHLIFIPAEQGAPASIVGTPSSQVAGTLVGSYRFGASFESANGKPVFVSTRCVSLPFDPANDVPSHKQNFGSYVYIQLDTSELDKQHALDELGTTNGLGQLSAYMPMDASKVFPRFNGRGEPIQNIAQFVDRALLAVGAGVGGEFARRFTTAVAEADWPTQLDRARLRKILELAGSVASELPASFEELMECSGSNSSPCLSPGSNSISNTNTNENLAGLVQLLHSTEHAAFYYREVLEVINQRRFERTATSLVVDDMRKVLADIAEGTPGLGIDGRGLYLYTSRWSLRHVELLLEGLHKAGLIDYFYLRGDDPATDPPKPYMHAYDVEQVAEGRCCAYPIQRMLVVSKYAK